MRRFWILLTGLCVVLGLVASSAPAAETGVVVATEAIQPHMAIAGDGTIYVAFIQRGNICVAASRDGGRKYGEPVVAIDVQGRANGGAQRGPRIGVDAKGNLAVTAPVTFDDAEYKKRYPTADLYLVSSTDGGKTWTKPLQVNEVSKKAPESLHWMAVAPSGEVHVAWLDRRDRTGPGQDIYYAKVSGGRVSKNTQIASSVCECCAPGLAVDSAGNPFVAYREGGKKSSRELFALRSTDNGKSFTRPVQLNARDSMEDG